MSIGSAIAQGGAVLATGLVVLACSGDPDSREMVVRDSSGVRVVDLPSVSTISTRLALSATPVYRVGWDEENRQFENVVAGGLWSDGRAVVGDAGSTQEVVFLSSSGTVDAIVGGSGQGPGELRSIFGLVALAGDTVAVNDPENARVTLFTRAGTFATIGLTMPRPPYLLGKDDQANLLLGPPLFFVVGRRYETSWLRVPLVKLAASTGSADTIAWVDWDQSMTAGGGRDPFMSGGFATVDRSSFVVGRGDRPEVRWLDQRGELHQIVRWSEQSRTIAESEIAAWETEMRAALQRSGAISQADIEQSVSSMKEAIDGSMPFFGVAGPMPPYGGLLADRAGNVWIAGYQVPRVSSPGHYVVLDAQGGWSTRVDIPAGLRVLAVGTDRVLGVEMDAVDRQAVVLYRLVDPGSGEAALTDDDVR